VTVEFVMGSLNPVLEEALRCVRRGWAVLPVWGVAPDGRCRCGGAHQKEPNQVGKHPLGSLVPHGVKDATKSEAVVQRWWARFPDANLAVATGEPSGFDALDVDGEDGEATVRRFEKDHGEILATVEQISGSGARHVCFAHAPGLKNGVKFAPGLDLRTTGGYILVEPSRHRSGRAYAWDAGGHPDETPFALWPAWLLERVPKHEEKETADEADVPEDVLELDEQPPDVVERARKYLAEIEGAVSGERGHDKTFRAACKIVRGFALPLAQALPLLREWNLKCKPPWSEKELVHKIKGALKKKRGKDEGPIGWLLNAKRNQPTASTAGSVPGTHFRRGDHAELADRLLDTLARDRDLVVHDEGRLYAFELSSGVWRPKAVPQLRRIVKGFAGAPCGADGRALRVKLTDANGAAALAGDEVYTEGFFAAAPTGISFRNGFLAVGDDGSLTLRPLAPQNRARWGYDFAHDARASCPRWISFLAETFEGENDAEERVALLQEFGGVSLLGVATRLQKALCCTGGGGNGKGVTLAVLAGLMPPGTVESIAPQSWTNEYRLARLAGKLLNTVNELPEFELLDTEVVKCVISGDPTTARHIREAPFRFAPRAGHIFAANRLPRTSDSTHGFWRRFVVIAFNRTVKESKYILTLADDILAAERPAIVCWALEGAARALRQRGYTIPASSRKALDDWRRDADPLRRFLLECARKPAEGQQGARGKEVYAAYKAWCRENGDRALAQNVLGSRLRSMGFGSRHTDKGGVYPFVVTNGEGSLFDEDARDHTEAPVSEPPAAEPENATARKQASWTY
jgi:putative DNA primase/helicase